MSKIAIGILVGTRPTIIKHAPLIREFKKRNLPFFVIHAGQHYSDRMDGIFFRELEIPYPKYVLNSVKHAKGHGAQTARMLRGIEEILVKEKPAALLVGGDTNANLAGALAARKLHLRLGHVESGARSFDWRMPEEHNRVMIDHISDWLFTPSPAMKKNLICENVRGKILVTGSTIVDAVKEHSELASDKSRILEKLNLDPNQFMLVTVHREHNVDSRRNLRKILVSIRNISKHFPFPVIFPLHPRTRLRIKSFGLGNIVNGRDVRFIDPLGYLDFLCLLESARVVLTDSGGVQQEACILKVPCVTLRENTEWTETLDVRANRLAGIEPDSVLRSVKEAVNSRRNWMNPFQSGASRKIVSFVVCECLNS